MKTFNIQIKNPMVTSVVKTIEAENKNDAEHIARETFKFNGDKRYIKITELK